MEYKGVERTERGWAGHFCAAWSCVFHRNTLLEHNGIKIVVSSVGKMIVMRKDGEHQLVTIGHERYYETMVWYANDDKYQDADVKKGELYFDCPSWGSDSNGWDEMPANELHEKVVDMFVEKLLKGEIEKP